MKAIFAGILFLALWMNVVQAATIASKAGVYNWNDPNAWVGGKVPTATDDVVISAGADITIITNVSCNSLTLQGDKSTASKLTIAGTNTLNVKGNVLINDGNPRTILAVGDGTLLVGNDLTIRGNNLQAELTIRLGTVEVVGNLNLPNVTNQQFITGDPNYPNQSTFTVGGSVGSKGTIKDVDINGYKTGDYFRSKNSGNWNVAGTWQASHDNVKWFNATVAPPRDARRVTVVFPHVVTHQTSVIHDNEIIVNGVLDCGVYTMTGAGTFSLNAGATIRTKDPNGIVLTGAVGSIQHNGSRTYSPDANYTYDGTVAQNTGNGLPSILNGTLTINTSVAMPAGVTLSQPTRIRKLVDITRGRLISNGNLTIEATASSNGNVRGPIVGGVLTSANQYLAGNVNVESWFSGGDITYRGTRTISSPVNNVPIFEQLQQKMLITGQGAGFDAPATQETILTYYEPAKISDGVLAQYQSLLAGIKTSPIPGLGYFLLYHGDRALDPTGTNPPQSLTATYIGVINQGDIRIDLSYTNNTGPRDDEYNGFNLVGNPYPAVIDWLKVSRSDITQIDNMVSVIRPGGGMMTYSNGIVTNALPAGAPVPGNGSSISFYIQPGQGFYVRTRSAGTFLTFTEASKAVNNSPVRLLSVPKEPFLAFNSIMGNVVPAKAEPIPQVLRLHLQDGKNTDETAIVFKDGNSAVYGGADVTYFSGSSVSLSSVTSDGKNVAINFMPDIKEVPELKLWVNTTFSGPVKLNFTDFKGVGEYQVFLKDTYLDKVVNVKVSPVYEFSIDKDNANTFGSERFKLLFQAPVCTDAASISLKGKNVNKGVELSFMAKGEKNNNPFEVERATDGKSFAKIAQVPVKEQSGGEYIFLDKNPRKGINYYRLKQKNSAGSWNYSNVFSVDLGFMISDKNWTLNVFPNPAVDIIHINYNSPDRDLLMSIYNVFGKKIKEMSFKRQTELKGNISELSQGIYLIELSDASNKQIMGRAKFYKN